MGKEDTSSIHDHPGLRALLSKHALPLRLAVFLNIMASAVALLPYILVYFLVLELLDNPVDEVDRTRVWALAGAAAVAPFLKAVFILMGSEFSHVGAFRILYDCTCRTHVTGR